MTAWVVRPWCIRNLVLLRCGPDDVLNCGQRKSKIKELKQLQLDATRSRADDAGFRGRGKMTTLIRYPGRLV